MTLAINKMGQISINSKAGPITFKITGDTPTQSESVRIQKRLRKINSEVSPKSVTGQRDEAVFDRVTGIQDGKLRRMLGRADTREDEEKVLKEAFGLLETEFTRDNRGKLALTPEGAKKFGVETDKNVIIDEQGFTRQDFSDLAGVGTTVAGGVTGAVLGTLVGGPVGGIIGAGLGGAGGKSVEEATEALQGVQAQEAEEIAKDIAVEGLISAAGEGIFAGLGKVFRVVRGTGRVGKGLPDERYFSSR